MKPDLDQGTAIGSHSEGAVNPMPAVIKDVPNFKDICVSMMVHFMSHDFLWGMMFEKIDHINALVFRRKMHHLVCPSIPST